MRIVGRTVVLRDFEPADVPVLREWIRPHHDWHRWDGPYFDRPTDAEADAFCEAVLSQATPRERLVVADPEDDRLVGLVSWYWESKVSDWRRIGVVLYDPATWSGGRGTEAVALWTTYLFVATDIARLDFMTWSGNERMCRVGARLGWTEEARFRDAREVDGQRYDSVVYGVLRSEWAARG